MCRSFNESSSTVGYPGTSQEPPRNLPGTSQEPPRNLPGTSQEPPRNLPGTSQEPPRNLPGTSQEPPRNLVGTSQEPPRNPPPESPGIPVGPLFVQFPLECSQSFPVHQARELAGALLSCAKAQQLNAFVACFGSRILLASQSLHTWSMRCTVILREKSIRDILERDRGPKPTGLPDIVQNRSSTQLALRCRHE